MVHKSEFLLGQIVSQVQNLICCIGYRRVQSVDRSCILQPVLLKSYAFSVRSIRKSPPHFRRKIRHLKTNAIFLTILPFREIHYFTCLIKYCYYNIMNLVCGQRQTFFRVFNFLCPGKMGIFFSDNAILSGYNELSDTELMQCKNLFDNHYGKWGEGFRTPRA